MGAPLLRVQLLGTFSLVSEGAILTTFRSARLQSLLAYLLLHRTTPPSRQRLAFTFWPDTTDKQAQTNLRQLLHTLRQRLPAAELYLHIDEQNVAWQHAAPYVFDVAEFESALEMVATRSGATKIEPLERAVAAYAGNLLPDCYDDWILPLREQLAQKFIGALEGLISLHEEGRNYAAAITHAQRLLAYDPLHESTYRRLMRLYALSDDRAAALRIYHTCLTTLEREMGVPPSEATLQAYERLLQVEREQITPATIRSPFVGRQDEWQKLQAMWRTVNRGRLQVVCIEGEAGLGKSRLAGELLHWAQQQGIYALQIRTYATERDLGYAPLVECLRCAAIQPTLTQLAAVWRSELARLLPELLENDPTLSVPVPLTERWQRQRLFDALLRAIAPEKIPLLLLFDDLQWCDAETLEWLLYLVNHRVDARLLLVITARPEEILPAHPASQFILDLRRLDCYSELPLFPLDAAETTALAAGIAGTSLTAAQAEQLFAATEGNPLFIVETMHSLPADAHQSLTFQAVPPKVQAVIQARLGQLSSVAHELAGVAATIGRSFQVDVLTTVCEYEEATVVVALDELWRRRIVREQGVASYDFRHARLRESAYSELPPARRRSLHRRLVTALEHLYPARRGAIAIQLAHHAEQGGLLEQAVHYLQQAASAARQLHSFRQAIAHLTHAIELLNSLQASDVILERELEVQVALSNDWAAITNHAGAEVTAAFERSLLLCRQLRFTPHLFTVYWGLHEIALHQGNYAESLNLAQQCLRIAEEVGEPGLLLQGHHALWGVYHFAGDYRRALAHMEAGMAYYQHPLHEELSPHYGWHDAACCALGSASLALWHLGFLDQARAKQQALCAHCDRLTQPFNIADGYGGIAELYIFLGQPASAQPYAEMKYRTGVEQGYPGVRSGGAVLLGWSLVQQNRVEEGIALIEEGLKTEQALSLRVKQSWKYVLLAEAYLLAGRLTDAMTTLEQGIAAFARYRDEIYAADLWTTQGLTLLASGADTAQVEACYATALDLAHELSAKTSELRAATQLARLYQRQGRASEGKQLLLPIYNWFSEGLDTQDLLAAKGLLNDLG